MENEKATDAIVVEETTVAVPLKEFEKDQAFLIKVVEDYSSLVITKETFEEGKKARAYLRELRYSIQNTLAENKGVLNKIKTDREQKAMMLIGLLTPLEELLDSSIKGIEKEAEEEKKRKEKELEDKRMNRVNTLLKLEMKWNGTHYNLGENSIDSLQVKNMPDDLFTEFLEKVKVSYTALLAAREEEARLKKEEEERIEKQRLANEAESQRLAALKKEQEEMEAKIKAEQDQKEAALKQQQQELENQRKAQEDKLAKEKSIAEKEAKDREAKLDKEKAEFEARITQQKVDQLIKLGFELQGNEYSFAENLTVTIEELKNISDDDLLKIADEVNLIKNMQEEQRINEEKRAAERNEALRPDKDKLVEFVEMLALIPYPVLNDHKAQEIMTNIKFRIESVSTYINEELKKL